MTEYVYIRPEVKCGRRGKYWWSAYDESGACIFSGPPPGYKTKDAAWRAVERAKNAQWLEPIEAAKPKRPWWKFWWGTK